MRRLIRKRLHQIVSLNLSEARFRQIVAAGLLNRCLEVPLSASTAGCDDVGRYLIGCADTAPQQQNECRPDLSHAPPQRVGKSHTGRFAIPGTETTRVGINCPSGIGRSV